MKKWIQPEVNEVLLKDAFFSGRVETNHTATIPANIEKCRETGRIEAFELKWKPGMPKMPHIFWDSDFAKVLEGMAMDLMIHPNKKQEKELNKYVDLVISAQQPDGYLNTHFTLVEPEKRWTNLADWHELYCAGHLMEAAVAHFKATGKRNFLDCMCRYADYIISVFGREKGKKRGYPGHEEIELALCKLAEATGKDKYFKQAEYFVTERGNQKNHYYVSEFKKRTGSTVTPDFFKAQQANLPLKDQKDATGHAVRQLYFLAGAADVAEKSGDKEIMKACERLWDSIVNRNMYITGGIGSTRFGEKFTRDYHLPNVTAYAESCAAIALVLFASRMLNITGDAKYADVMERALFNGAISGLGFDGVTFFYENPLEVNLEGFNNGSVTKRQAWFDCSCCPTNYCRFVPQLGSFAVSKSENGAAIHIPVSSEADFGSFAFTVESGYPYDGKIMVKIVKPSGRKELALRIPDWCSKYTLKLNGKKLTEKAVKGYIKLARSWKKGDTLELDLEIKVRVLYANDKVTDDAGKIALMRGPIVYTLESVDNKYPLSQMIIPTDQEFKLTAVKGLPKETIAITGEAFAESVNGNTLYFEGKPKRVKTKFTAIPFALWQNRGDSSMRVWIRGM